MQKKRKKRGVEFCFVGPVVTFSATNNNDREKRKKKEEEKEHCIWEISQYSFKWQIANVCVFE